jgi:hypothetical protein
MQNKKSVRVLGLLLFSILVISISANFILALGAGDMVDYETAQKLGYSDEGDYAAAHGGSYLLTDAEASKLGGASASAGATASSPSAGASIIKDISGPIAATLSTLAKNADPIVKFVLGSVDVPSAYKITAGEMLVVKLLVFILMLVFLYYATSQVPGVKDSKTAVWLISAIIAILATRYLTTAAIVNLVWAPSGALGIALTAGFPFLIFFFFIESFQNTIIRKVGWIFMLVVFFFLAIVRWDATANPAGGLNYGWIYILTSVLCAVALYFDKNIRAMFVRLAFEKASDEKRTADLNVIGEQISYYRTIERTPVGSTAPANWPAGNPPTSPVVATGATIDEAAKGRARRAIRDLQSSVGKILK